MCCIFSVFLDFSLKSRVLQIPSERTRTKRITLIFLVLEYDSAFYIAFSGTQRSIFKDQLRIKRTAFRQLSDSLSNNTRGAVGQTVVAHGAQSCGERVVAEGSVF